MRSLTSLASNVCHFCKMGCSQIGAVGDLGLRRLEGSSLNSTPASAKYRTGDCAARPEKKASISDQSTTCSIPRDLPASAPGFTSGCRPALENGGCDGKKSQLSPDFPSMASTAPTVFPNPVK